MLFSCYVKEKSVQEPEPTPAPTPTASPPSGNPIAVSPDLMGDALASTGDVLADIQLCKDVNLSSVAVPPNPGFRDETSGAESITGDELWAISFYTMLYSNCERQARGTYDFIMFTDELMLGLQETIYGVDSSHGRFEERAQLSPGAAEGHGGGRRIGTEIREDESCLLYTSPSPRDRTRSRMPSSA